MDAAPHRVKVVGNSGAGKTTFARELARRLDVPHLELDAAFWGAGWQLVDAADGRAAVSRFLTTPEAERGWVVDGNWNSRLGDVLTGLEAVVWLDFPRYVVLARVLRRTLVRAALRVELWHGNRERWSSLVRRQPEENIVLWAWTQHDAYRAQYLRLAADGTIPVIRLGHPREARRWLRDVRAADQAHGWLSARREPGRSRGARRT